MHVFRIGGLGCHGWRRCECRKRVRWCKVRRRHWATGSSAITSITSLLMHNAVVAQHLLRTRPVGNARRTSKRSSRTCETARPEAKASVTGSLVMLRSRTAKLLLAAPVTRMSPGGLGVHVGLLLQRPLLFLATLFKREDDRLKSATSYALRYRPNFHQPLISPWPAEGA